MLARVNVIEVQPSAMNEAVAFWETHMLPILKRQPGFRGTYVWGNRERHKLIVTSLWETESAFAAWTSRNTAQEQHARIAPLLVSQTREDYEVLVQYEK